MNTPVTAYLSLGSNLGDRLAHLIQAVRALAEAGRRPCEGHSPSLVVRAVSPVYETAPLGVAGGTAGVEGQPAYLNCAVQVATHLPPLHLLWLTAGIEAALGRVRLQHWGPRTVDIDLILYGNEQIDLSDLTVPHPRATERAFVLRPLLDLDPGLVLPSGGALMAHLAALPPQAMRVVLSGTEFSERMRHIDRPG